MTAGGSAAEVHASGIVVAVRPRIDGSFAVTVGPGPEMYWYTTREPPKLGTEVTLIAEAVRVTPIGKHGRVTELGKVAVQAVPPPYDIRVVDPEWKKRVAQVMRRPLYRYQVEGAAWIASQLAAAKGAILGDDMGLGKSAQAIAAIVATNMYPAVVVCPTGVKINWAREFSWTVNPPTIEILNTKRGEIRGADVIILNRDLLTAREEQLGNLHARCFVLDEAQDYKHPKPSTKHRAAAATRLSSWIGRTVELTGTPVYNKLRDLWRLLHNADPSEWRSFEEFDQRYCRAPPDDDHLADEQTSVINSAGRVEHLEELKTRVEPILLRRRKHEVAQDLPPQSARQILVEIDEWDMRAYKQAEGDIIAWMRSQQFGDVRARAASRAQAIVKLTTLRHLAAQGKMRRAIPEYLEQWFDRETVEPLVVFGFHKDILIAIYNECMRLRQGRVSIVGSADPAVKRQRAVDMFNAGYTDVFIAPIKCAGVGLNLQERASDLLFTERLWEPTMMRQAIARCHRIGQRRPVMATFLDAAGTVDEYIAGLSADKEILIAHTLDDPLAVDEAAVLEEALGQTDALIDSYARAG
jgi:SNF2 family DNA or RNA helicase